MTLLDTALSAGLKADYVLFDFWFPNPAQITSIHSKGMDVIAMIKKSSRIKYSYGGEQLNIKEFYSRNKKRRGRSKYLLSVDVMMRKENPIPAKIVCVRNKANRKDWDHFIFKDFTEMTSRLDYLKDIRGINVFTARPGMGKSYCLRCLAKSLNPSLFHMKYLCLSTISVADFYKQLCAILGVPDKGGKTVMFKAIQEQITYLYKEKRQPFLLAVDKAQYLNTGILNDIKMLMNYGYYSVNYFTLILCGESHLNDTLRKPVHEALRQRITVHYNYSGLSDEEVSKYILHKIQLAGASGTIIDLSALAATHSFTLGNPRLIDNLMTDALTIGAQQDKKVIDADVIRAAVENQGLY